MKHVPLTFTAASVTEGISDILGESCIVTEEEGYVKMRYVTKEEIECNAWWAGIRQKPTESVYMVCDNYYSHEPWEWYGGRLVNLHGNTVCAHCCPSLDELRGALMRNVNLEKYGIVDLIGKAIPVRLQKRGSK